MWTSPASFARFRINRRKATAKVITKKAEKRIVRAIGPFCIAYEYEAPANIGSKV